MEISEVERIARLARLGLREGEKAALAKEMEAVLGLFRELDRAPAAEEPLHHALRLEDKFRPDEPRPCLNREEVLKNAAATEQGYVRGPRIIAPKKGGPP